MAPYSCQQAKDFRRIATRYDKADSSFAAAIYLVAAFLASLNVSGPSPLHPPKIASYRTLG
jgi:hypothetical protein